MGLVLRINARIRRIDYSWASTNRKGSPATKSLGHNLAKISSICFAGHWPVGVAKNGAGAPNCMLGKKNTAYGPSKHGRGSVATKSLGHSLGEI